MYFVTIIQMHCRYMYIVRQFTGSCTRGFGGEETPRIHTPLHHPLAGLLVATSSPRDSEGGAEAAHANCDTSGRGRPVELPPPSRGAPGRKDSGAPPPHPSPRSPPARIPPHLYRRPVVPDRAGPRRPASTLPPTFPLWPGGPCRPPRKCARVRARPGVCEPCSVTLHYG